MTILLTIIATVGWLAAFGIHYLFRMLARVYTAEKMQNEVLRMELNELRPNDSSQWLPPHV